MKDPGSATLLHDVFDRQVRTHPHAVALEIPPSGHCARRVELSYHALDMEARALEDRLPPLISGHRLVALLLPRTTADAFAAQLAILRAGGAYVAIDPASPDGRVRELLEDSQAAAVVTDAAGAARLRPLVVETPILTPTEAEHPRTVAPSHPSTFAPSHRGTLAPTDPAYVIYTSGTTGRPKGVVVEHRAIVNLVEGDRHEFGLGPGDRVAQNSSLAYDSSLEEIWLAWAAGATLVVMDDETARSGPDVVPWLERERITVFCPAPTLLRATGQRSPAGLLPHLRLLYVGGEALTEDVTSVWAPGRRMVNGYGPTECAVTAIRGDVLAGAPVSIGRPIPNVTAHVLDAALTEVAPGSDGELCLGGACLARGYWRDDELTHRKFVEHASLGRLYRTGDLARRLPDGTLTCLGRVDAQVKIRGHRVELEEIEARLAACSGVRAAACALQQAGGRTTLVGFIVPDPLYPAPNLNRIRDEVAAVLPDHMVPAALGVIDDLPMTLSAKLDRAALPTIAIEPRATAPSAQPMTPMESVVADAVSRATRSRVDIGPDTDLFADLRGDSLIVAEVVNTLREHPAMAAVTVRTVYQARTVRAIARHAERTDSLTPAGLAGTAPRSASASRVQLIAFTTAQALWLAVELAVMSLAAYGLVFMALPLVAASADPVTLALLAPPAFALGLVGYLVFSAAVATVVKRVVIGRYVAERVPAWGTRHLRHWIVRDVVRLIPWTLLEGTIFQSVVLRALGARVGRRVHVHRGVDLLQGGWDLLELGDDVTLGQESVLRLVDFDAGHVVSGPIHIGAGATVETRANVSAHAVIAPGGYLTALSSLPAGARIPAGECWTGVPAEPAGRAPLPPALDPAERALSPAAHGVLLVAGRLAGLTAAPALFAIAAAAAFSTGLISAGAVAAWLQSPALGVVPMLAMLTIGLLSVPVSVTASLITCRLMGRISTGTIGRWSPEYLRVWVKVDLVRRAGDWLSGTLLWPMWLRAAGMRLGPDCEISTIIDVVPEHVEIGGHSFFADGIYLGGARVHRGTVTMAATTLGSRVFLGNHVVIPAGCRVPDGVLIGVCTVADDRAMTPGSAWFGLPPFALSRPPAIADKHLTHAPSAIRRVNRWFWELGKLAFPVATTAVSAAMALFWLQAAATASALKMMAVVTPAIGLAGPLLLAATVLVLKWTLLWRVRPGEHALWSCWCSRWDYFYVAWDRLARPFLSRFEGTLLLSWYLRAMGMRIGRRVLLGSGFAQVVDPDMIDIDDDATVHALFQAHTFEDRMLKIDRVRIGRGATVACGAVVFYGAHIGDGARVAPQSVIMKRERLGEGGQYEGVPSVRLDSSVLAAQRA